MLKRVLTATITIGLFMIPCLVHTEVYQWVDEKGTTHFTDDYSNVPSSYRDRLKIRIWKDTQEEGTSSEPQKKILRVKEEPTQKGIYAQEEAEWKEKIRPWMEKLKESTENYEAAQKKFFEKSTDLSRRRFGSPTMYKFDIIKLDQLNEERMKYKAQMAEADEMIKKLSKEAEKFNFNPQGVPSPKRQGITKDMYGLGEEEWRNKLKPWRENQRELNSEYRDAENKFMGKTLELSKRRYGNRHTIKSNVIELDRSKKEVGNYQTQIAENEEMLKRIFKEAEEANADPDWLK